MKLRTFLMPALVMYMALGNLCILTKAYALPVEGPSGLMSYAEPKSSLPPSRCPFAKDTMKKGATSPCADGHCYKYQPPDDSASKSHTTMTTNRMDACPPPSTTESLETVMELSDPEKLWEPPPLIDQYSSVVRLE